MPETVPGPPRPTGRTALVTGAGNGLGRAISLQLAAAGVRVVLTGRTVGPLQETADLIAERSGEPQGVGSSRVASVDVSDPDSVNALAAAVSDEQISILVNNAGVPGPVASLIDIDITEWNAVFDVNVTGMFLMCKAFLPPMIERGSGDVINLASVSGKRPLARRTPYCASKMAVLGLTTTLAAEVGPLGITVNSLSPGPVEGPRMHRNFAMEAERTGRSIEQARDEFAGRALLGRLLEEEEVGFAVVAMLAMPGLHAADIDLSAGMVAR
ncbi:NAD(P)-dependent dehydrogenase (short-subunit alcohol dehydrogenase family) [Nakamurella sp. UYEF19]|uniref:SDR family NAD(P)-dependent oxidoreductase n=1 Tax=Nakamurella sp. UYEF19 TaxID=1756392 RepID=UPI00339632F0